MPTTRSLLCLLPMLGWFTPVDAADVIQPGDTLALCGDSITVGKQYSIMVEDYFLMCHPIPRLRVLAFGAGGENAQGLAERMDIDVLRFKPTVMTTLYGMNDARYLPLDPEHEDSYRKGQAAIIAKAKLAGVRTIVIASPTLVDPFNYHRETSTTAVYNATLKRLGEIGKEIATSNGLLFSDVHSEFEVAMDKAKAANGPGFLLTGDGVHPLQDGYLVIAYTLLRTCGCSGDIATITMDMADGSAHGTPGQKILAAKAGSVSIESTQYPFCFWGNAHDANTSLAMLPFLPFNQDLNRFMLVVTHLTTARATVTWGGHSREFTAQHLSAGINLAAEFLENPFVAQFQKVDHAVRVQQDTQEILDHEFMREIPRLRQAIPDEDATWELLIKKGMEHDAMMDRAAAALVIPISHAITIEPLP